MPTQERDKLEKKASFDKDGSLMYVKRKNNNKKNEKLNQLKPKNNTSGNKN